MQHNPDLPFELTPEWMRQQLPAFELGRHLLANKSLDGYWTQYCVVEHPKNRDLPTHPLEAFFLNQAPTILATQERFTIFRNQLQQRLKGGMVIASVPCGYMDDLLDLDYRDATNVTLVGCDIDTKSCTGTRENAAQHGLTHVTEIHCMDAWDLGSRFPGKFDMLTSNGLNIYVPNPAKEQALYANFAQALKPGGWLVTSFLTPPPQMDAASPWQDIDPQALALQKTLFSDVLGVTWQNYRMPQVMENALRQAGFGNIEIHYDRQHLFPTIVAQKL